MLMAMVYLAVFIPSPLVVSKVKQMQIYLFVKAGLIVSLQKAAAHNVLEASIKKLQQAGRQWTLYNCGEGEPPVSLSQCKRTYGCSFYLMVKVKED
jgi:hypothetical protein